MNHRMQKTEELMIGNIAEKAMENLLEKRRQTERATPPSNPKRFKTAAELLEEIRRDRKQDEKLNEELIRFVHAAEKGEYDAQMTFANLILRLPYWQDIHVYVTNIHGENIPLYHGKKGDIEKQIYSGSRLLKHLLDEVVAFRGLKVKNRENSMIFLVKDRNYEKPLSVTVPRYVAKKWDKNDPKTRPYLLNTEIDGDVLFYNHKQEEKRRSDLILKPKPKRR